MADTTTAADGAADTQHNSRGRNDALIQECRDQMLDIKNRRSGLNREASGIRKRLKEAGVQPEAFDFVLKCYQMEPEGRDEYLDSVRENLMGMEIGGQGALFIGALDAAVAKAEAVIEEIANEEADAVVGKATNQTTTKPGKAPAKSQPGAEPASTPYKKPALKKPAVDKIAALVVQLIEFEGRTYEDSVDQACGAKDIAPTDQDLAKIRAACEKLKPALFAALATDPAPAQPVSDAGDLGDALDA